ncbi:uncharacterized protein LOC134249299 isoform X3 [Saccostrea cucullata]|uniref:uncharacterized protein LOC134249299 isoform X3 n=1 Tax=Saccostrea cuccullata TaxID=36930 RepID=UPI002ED4A170
MMQDTEIAMYENMWRSQAKLEAGKQRSGRHQRGRGSCVLLILDCSESMRGQPLREMKRGVFTILDEFYQNPGMGENVSVIVMGHETKFLQYYSNQYLAIKRHIEEVECGGPSPLTAAFILALGGLLEGADTSTILCGFTSNRSRSSNFLFPSLKKSKLRFITNHIGCF